MIKRVGLATLMLAGSVILAGCGSATPAAKSHSGGTVVIAEAPDSPPNWFPPILSSTAYTAINEQIQYLLYRPLIYLNSQNQVDYAKSLVKRISVTNNGTTYTLTMSHKYRWSNGRPVTSQDVVFFWNIIKDASTLKNSPWAYGATGSGGVPNDWQSVTAKGPNTAIIVLKNPANPQWFIRNGLSQISPIPESIWNKYPHNPIRELRFIASVANSPTNPVYRVVDGPFRFKSWQPNNYWELVPNQHFGGHKASISKLIFQYETSSASEFVGLRNGTVSVGYLPPSMWGARNKLPDDVRTASYLFGMNFMIPNLSPKAPEGIGPVFSQLYVREALEMGIDQPGIIKTLYHGAGVVSDGPIPPKPNTAFFDPALRHVPYPFNPAAGKALLEAHGWHDVNGVMTKGGQKLAFTVTYMAGSTTATRVMELIKSDWAREGISATLQTMPINEILATAVQSDPTKWQMAYWGGAGWTYQVDYYPTGGELFATDAAENDSGYSSPVLDHLIQSTYESGTSSQIKARMDAYQVFMAKNLPVLWMPWLPQGYARMIGFNEHNKDVRGTVSTFNPVTNFPYANYWTVTS
jgi:peptide/nickel transport system substrate-binding protein